MNNLLISFSGGLSSALMLKLILTHPKYKGFNKLVVFANTSKENNETLDFVNDCAVNWGVNIHWLEAKVTQEKGIGTTFNLTTYTEANRTGVIFESVIQKYGLPSKMYRHCTRELKQVPIHKFAKHYFNTKNYLTAIGIRKDEENRIKKSDKYIYPLYDANIDEKAVREFWDRQSFTLKLKDYQGNCDLCFLKSIRKKKTLIKENISVTEFWQDMEKKYSSIKQPAFDVYRNFPITKLIEEAKKPFRKALDKHDLRKSQRILFDNDDKEYGCFCGN